MIYRITTVLFWFNLCGAFLVTDMSLHRDKKPVFSYSKFTNMPTTTHTFNYKKIPYNIGIQQIHELESIPQAIFRVKSTSLPVSYGPCRLISCECEFMGKSENIRMFTDRPNESQIIVFLKEGIPYVNIQLIVSQLLEGHRLRMICTYYRNPKMIYMRLEPLLDFMHCMENSCGFPLINEDSNLNAYRKMIML